MRIAVTVTSVRSPSPRAVTGGSYLAHHRRRRRRRFICTDGRAGQANCRGTVVALRLTGFRVWTRVHAFRKKKKRRTLRFWFRASGFRLRVPNEPFTNTVTEQQQKKIQLHLAVDDEINATGKTIV